MGFARIAAVVVAASVLWCAAAGAGGPLRPFKHGFWSGGAYTDDRTGAFTHCSAGVAYDSGINLFVLVTGGYRWWLGLINPKWELMPNAKASIKLQLDDGTPFDGLASIPSGQLLLVSLPDSSKLLAAFRRSSRLALDAEGQSFFFKLNGTPAVMDQLANCVRTSLTLAAQAPPATPSTAVSPTSEAKTAPARAAGSAAAPAPSESSATAGSESSAATAEAAPSAAAARPQPPEASPTTSAMDGATAQSQTSPPVTATPLTTPLAKPPRKSGPDGAPAAPATSGAERAADGARESPVPPLSGAPMEPALPAREKPMAAAQPTPAAPASPPLAFTSAPAILAPPAGALALEAPPVPATATAIEEVRLATDFVTKARLQDARLVVADKPPALADFSAVWRSEDAAGAVKIIPAGPDVSGIAIASNLIAVDPQVCKGDFSTARFRTDLDNSVVFSAVLSCSAASEQRVTEYFVTPRHQGGFVVFAVIRSKAVGEPPGFDWRKIDELSKAAIQAADAQG
jgi:hypothetical protein